MSSHAELLRHLDTVDTQNRRPVGMIQPQVTAELLLTGPARWTAVDDPRPHPASIKRRWSAVSRAATSAAGIPVICASQSSTQYLSCGQTPVGQACLDSPLCRETRACSARTATPSRISSWSSVT